MARQTTPTFTHELRLKPQAVQVRQLNIRFECLRKLYNACLGELFKRQRALQRDPAYGFAIEAYRAAKQAGDEPARKAQAKTLKALDTHYGLTEAAIQSYATACKNACYFKDHLDAHTTQTIASRALAALSDWRFKGKGKPRFKSWKNALRSISGKTDSCVIFRSGKLKWNGLAIPVVYDHRDKFGVEAHALSCPVKYCRVVRREVKGKYNFYLQLVLKGEPRRKANQPVVPGRTGIDVGPSTIAAVGASDAILTPFCATLDNLQAEITRLQRQLNRSQRLANPHNYEPVEKRRGEQQVTTYRVKKGARHWVYSNRYRKLQRQLRELHRTLRDSRKYLHEVLANQILALGNEITAEALSYKAFQRCFGRSVAFRAPGMFITLLKRKAEKAGGQYIDIPTWRAKLSQYDHLSDTHTKKPLNERVHRCGETVVQRDLYSAFLAHCWDPETNTVDRRQALAAFPSMRFVLARALSMAYQATNGPHRLASLGLAFAKPGAESLARTSLMETGLPFDCSPIETQPA